MKEENAKKTIPIQKRVEIIEQGSDEEKIELIKTMGKELGGDEQFYLARDSSDAVRVELIKELGFFLYADAVTLLFRNPSKEVALALKEKVKEAEKRMGV